MPPTFKPAPSQHAEVRLIGQPNPGAATIFIYEQVLEQVLEYSEADVGSERGGFLLGRPYEDRGTYVEICGFLPAQQTAGSAARLTFTHATWSCLRQQAERQFPDEQLVGWHHTHPDLGVFLSEYDRFIQRNFFSALWHVALVVDPCRGEFAFFQWAGHDLLDAGFAWIPGAPPADRLR